MQRLAARIAPVGVAGAAAHRAAHGPAPQTGHEPPTSPRMVEVQEAPDGFMAVAFAAPLQEGEVRSALSTFVGAARGGPAPAPAAPAPPGPIIEEVWSERAESEASTEDAVANHLMASMESLYPAFDEPPPLPSTFDLLAATVTNVLSNPQVVGEISRSLATDPAFAELMRHVSPGSSLPAPARVLLVEDVTAGEAEEADTFPPVRGGSQRDPLAALLGAVQRGVVAAATHLGMAFVHVGHFLRGLGEHLRDALAGIEAGEAAREHGDSPGPERVNWELAISKVAVAVAVVVLTRRAALSRLAVV